MNTCISKTEACHSMNKNDDDVNLEEFCIVCCDVSKEIQKEKESKKLKHAKQMKRNYNQHMHQKRHEH